MNKRLIEDVIKANDKYDSLAVATIIDAKSSAPRDVGTSMIIYPDGDTNGTIGGGNQEKEIIEKAVELLKEGKSGRMSFSLTRKEAAKIGWVCGGDIEIYIENVNL
ncbi:MAG TPA: XdhC family protein [Halanaerobiales bacterium]|nr:XdhC family protein [Halanaerobiales bacterium]